MRRSVWLVVLSALSALIATGCSSGLPGATSAPALAKAPARGVMYAEGADDGFLGDAESAPAEPPAASAAVPGGAVAPSDRLMIYSARYELLVANRDDAIDRFLGWVADAGGYLQARDDGEVVCRIPAARFFGLVERVPALGRVLRESMNAQDVTREVMDLNLRIENAEVARQRLLDLLGRATDTESILAIEKELHRLTEEIERMKGDLKFLTQQVAYSTLTVVFRSDAPDVTPPSHRARSRFPWLNEIGVDRVLEAF